MEKTLNLQLQGQNFEFLCKFDKRFSRLSMRPEGSIFKVNVPLSVSEKFLEKFLLNNCDWLFKVQKTLGSSLKLNLEHGEKLLFKGVESLKIYLDLDLPKNYIIDEGILFIKRLDLKIIQGFLRDQAADYLASRLDYFSQVTGLKYNELRIKDTKTRLGSCSSKKNINLSFRLMLLDPFISDYVVLHEVCHLRHMNHSEKYWDFVNDFMPDYKLRLKMLRQKEKEIMHYL